MRGVPGDKRPCASTGGRILRDLSVLLHMVYVAWGHDLWVLYTMAPLLLRFKGGTAIEGPSSLGSPCLRLRWAQKSRKFKMTFESIPQAREGGRSSWVLSTVSWGCEGTSEVHLLEAGTLGWAVTSRPQLSRCRTRRVSNKDEVSGRPETSPLGPLGRLDDP